MDPKLDTTRIGTPFQTIAAICREFEEHWVNGTWPSISKFLERVTPDARTTLFKNLLAIDIQHRTLTTTPPTLTEFTAAFPAYSDTIREVFLERSLHSVLITKAENQTVISDSTPASASPIPLRLGQFELIRELGRGAMGVVYEARKPSDSVKVALKSLPSVQAESLHLFKQEFRALASINHPNLIGLHSLEADGNHWFFTMDLVEGVDFLKHVRPEGKLDESKLRESLFQLINGVLALHSNHVLHRDLKPSNVMVHRDGRVVLLDFGLAVELNDQTEIGANELAGTPLYMSPEQAARRPVTAASDWYSVGVMLYQALSGTFPFTGSLTEVLTKKTALPAPQLPPLHEIPSDLSTLCMRLLERDPKNRPDNLAMAQFVSQTGNRSAMPKQEGQGLIGRTEQLKIIHTHVDQWNQSTHTSVIFISARSGEGKSTLAETILNDQRDHHKARVLVGRCYDRESMPYKALDSTIDSLSLYLGTFKEADLTAFLSEDIGVLAQIFPVLNRVPTIARTLKISLEYLDEQQIRQRAAAALKSLLFRLSQQTPLVLFVDDLQWGDQGSAEILYEVTRSPQSPKLLFLGTFRSDEEDKSAFLKTWERLAKSNLSPTPKLDVRLRPLSPEDSVELVVQLLGKDTPSIRSFAMRFALETGGNALLLTELIGGYDPETDMFESLEMYQVLERKLGRLPKGAAELLQTIAVSGQALPMGETAALVKVEMGLEPTLAKMRNERLIRIVNPDSESPQVDTYHDKVRETILHHMKPNVRSGLHLSLGSVIEKSLSLPFSEVISRLERGDKISSMEPLSNRIYDLAYHYDAGRDQKKACVYALCAAEKAGLQASLEVALQQYTIANRNSEKMQKEIKFRLAFGYGHTLLLLGKYEEAKSLLTKANLLASNRIKRAQVELLQGELAEKKAQLVESFQIFEKSLRELNVWVPSSLLGYLYGIVKESVVQAFHTFFPGRTQKLTGNLRKKTIVHIISRATSPLFFRNCVQCVWFNLTGLNRSERLPPSPILAQAYGNHGIICSTIGWFSRGFDYLARAEKLRRDFSDLWGLGQSKCYEGICCYMSGQFKRGVQVFIEAIQLLERAGDMWELNLSHFHKGCCHYELGEMGLAIEEAKKAFEMSVRIGEDGRAHCATLLWVKATQGRISYTDLKNCYRSVPQDIMSSTNALLGEGYWHLYNRRSQDGLDTIWRAFRLCMTNYLVNYHTIETLPALAMAHRLHGDHLFNQDPARSHKLKQRGYWLSWFSVLIMKVSFPVHYPMALREFGIQCMANGNLKKARGILRAATEAANRYQAKYEKVLSEIALREVECKLGIPGAEARLIEAKGEKETLETSSHLNAA